MLVKPWIYVASVILAIVAAYVVANPDIVSSIHSKSAGGPTANRWHEVIVASQHFKVSLPCQNTIATPKSDAYGFYGTVSDDVGNTAIACDAFLANNGMMVKSPSGCNLEAIDGPIPQPSGQPTVIAFLQAVSNDKRDPIISVHGATAIESITDSNNQTLYAVSGGNYYQLDADCSAGSQKVGQQFISSFKPLEQ